MQAERYNSSFEAGWDDFVEHSLNGTFLHTRRYLEYHGERLKDFSAIIKDESGKVIGLIPVAIDPKDERRVVSHPGITYGGILHKGDLRGARMVEAVAELKRYYNEQNFDVLQYKVVPHIYHRAAACDDLYAMFVSDAARYRCDLSCAIDLANRREMSSRRKRSLKKALKSGVSVKEGAHFAASFWRVLEENLAGKYDAHPVHIFKEITYLQSIFPDRIKFVVGLIDNQVVAGVVLFLTETVAHSQYIASISAGYETCALDAVFNQCIEAATSEGKRYFDFGTSNENDGRILNENLYSFKSEFGGGGVAHEFYELNLR